MKKYRIFILCLAALLVLPSFALGLVLPQRAAQMLPLQEGGAAYIPFVGDGEKVDALCLVDEQGQEVWRRAIEPVFLPWVGLHRLSDGSFVVLGSQGDLHDLVMQFITPQGEMKRSITFHNDLMPLLQGGDFFYGTLPGQPAQVMRMDLDSNFGPLPSPGVEGSLRWTEPCGEGFLLWASRVMQPHQDADKQVVEDSLYLMNPQGEALRVTRAAHQGFFGGMDYAAAPNRLGGFTYVRQGEKHNSKYLVCAQGDQILWQRPLRGDVHTMTISLLEETAAGYTLWGYAARQPGGEEKVVFRLETDSQGVLLSAASRQSDGVPVIGKGGEIMIQTRWEDAPSLVAFDSLPEIEVQFTQ